jgi:hypothetical protein
MMGKRETDEELDARIKHLHEEELRVRKALMAAERKRSDRMCGGRRSPAYRYAPPKSGIICKRFRGS